MTTDLSPAEIVKARQETLAKLNLSNHEIAVKELEDFLRAFLKEGKYEAAYLRQATKKERKLIAADFLDTRSASVPEGSNHREYFWPGLVRGSAGSRFREAHAQDVLADWIYIEVGRKPGKPGNSRLKAAGTSAGGTQKHGSQRATTTGPEREYGESASVTSGVNMAQRRVPSSTALGKRKADRIDVFDPESIDFDAYLPADEAATSSRNTQPARETREATEPINTRPSKIPRRTPESSATDPRGAGSEVEPAGPQAPPGIAIQRAEKSLASASHHFVELPVTQVGRAGESSDIRTSLERMEGHVAHVVEREANGRPSPWRSGEATHQSRRPASDALLSTTPRFYRREDLTEIPRMLLGRIEEAERVHLDAAHTSDNFDETKIALAKAKVLRDLRDELKVFLKSLEVKNAGGDDVGIAQIRKERLVP